MNCSHRRGTESLSRVPPPCLGSDTNFCAVCESGCPSVQMHLATMRMVLTALTVASMVGGLVSCAEKSSGEKPVPEARGSQTSTQIFSVKGVVKEVKPDGRTIVIKRGDPELCDGDDHAVLGEDHQRTRGPRSEEHTSELQSPY